MAFTPENLARAQQIVARYPQSRSATLPLLHLAQSQDGWVSPEAMSEISNLVGTTPSEVFGTCSFYTMFKRNPVGRLVVSVCTNVTCLVTGGPEVLEHLEDRFATAGDVHIEEVECLAACGGAPALQVNYEYHERMTPQIAEDLVNAYRSGERAARDISGASVEGR